MELTNQNLYSKGYSLVKTFLDGLNLDPKNRFKANLIHSSLPNINNKGFDGYPFIVLKVDINEEDKSFDAITSAKVFRVLIQIYSDQST